MSNTLLVQMRLTMDTVERVRQLKKTLQQDSQADTVASCVQIAEMIVDALKSGKQLQTVAPDGKRQTLVVKCQDGKPLIRDLADIA